MSESGDACLMAIMSNIPDDNDSHLILKALMNAFMNTNRKYPKSKQYIMKYIQQLMIQQHNESLKNDNIYTDELYTIINEACRDANALVRDQSFEALKIFQLKISPTKAQKIIDLLSPGAAKKYHRIKSTSNNKSLMLPTTSSSVLSTTASEATSQGSQRTSSIREIKIQMKKK